MEKVSKRRTVSVSWLERTRIEIIKDKLYFVSFDKLPPPSDEVYCFTVDDKVLSSISSRLSVGGI